MLVASEATRRFDLVGDPELVVVHGDCSACGLGPTSTSGCLREEVGMQRSRITFLPGIRDVDVRGRVEQIDVVAHTDSVVRRRQLDSEPTVGVTDCCAMGL